MRAVRYALCFLVIKSFAEVVGWEQVYDKDMDLDLNEFVKKLNFDGIESYDTTTKDGYIIKIERIKRRSAEKLMPVIIVHGMTACPKTYFLNKNSSIPIVLAHHNYDVWLINARGTENSQRHTKWNATTDREFWMFSWQEIGLIDLPAAIDVVLDHNIHDKVILIGHSEGSAVIAVTLSDVPEYNEKVALSVHLGVSVYHEGCATFPIMKDICLMEPYLSRITDYLGWFAMFPTRQLREAVTDLCRYTIFQGMCKEFGKIMTQSNDIKDYWDWSAVASYEICGASMRELYHFMQVANTGRFARYDYGLEKNLRIYNSTKPPLFHLEDIKSPIVLWCGDKDFVCTKGDMDKLISQLKNRIESTNFKGKSIFSHDDFILGQNLQETFFDDLLKILKKYSF